MLLQKLIEAKISEHIRAALAALDYVTVRGAWEEAYHGLTKWSEDGGETAAFVSVALSTPTRKAPTDPTAVMSANVSVFVRCECDPRGEKLCELCEILQELFERWITSEMDALDIPEFSVDGVALASGASPRLENAVCSVTYPLELSGSYT
jgi:hypothetical protein